MAGFPWENNDPAFDEPTTTAAPWENDPIVDDAPAAAWESNDPVIADSFDSEPQQKPSVGLVGTAFGVPVLEAGAGMASSMIGATIGGLAGIGELITSGGDWGKAAETVEGVSGALTYQPRTAEGQAVLEAASVPFELIAEFGEYLGEETLEATDSPVAATGARLVPDVIAMVAPIPFIKGAKGKGKAQRPPESVPEKTSAQTSTKAKGEEIIAERPSQKPVAEGVTEAIDGAPKKTWVEEIPPEIAREPVGIYLDAKNAPVMPKSKNGFVQAGETFIDATGGKAITPVRKLGRENKYFREIADQMEAPDTIDVTLAPRPVKAAFHEGVSLNTGKYVSMFQEATQPHLTRMGRMKPEIQAEVLKGLRDSKYKVADELKPLVWDIRKVLDDVHAYAKEAGVNVEYLKDYVPRVYNRKMVRDNPEKFAKVLVDHGLKPEVAKKITTNIAREEGVFDPFLNKIERIHDMSPEAILGMKSAKQKPTGGTVKGKKEGNLEHSRVLHNIPDEAFGNFLKDDVMGLLPRYIEHSVRRAEWVRRYGVDGVKLNNKIKKGIKYAQQKGQTLTRGEINRIYDIADAQQMQYKQIDNPAMAKANQWYSTYQLIRTLPMATLASIAEPGVIFLRGTMGGGFKGLGAGFKHAGNELLRKINKNHKKAEVTRAAEEVGLALDHAVTERMLDAFGGESTNITRAFFKINLLDQWTRLNRVAGYEAGKQMTIGHLQRMAGKKEFGAIDKFHLAAARQRYNWELKELGVDVQKGIEWVNNGMNKADPFYEQIKTAGVRFTNDVVMHPRVTNRPMWHSNPHLRLLNQLKGFQTTFGNTVTKRMIHEMFGKGAVHGSFQALKFFSVLSAMANLNIAVQMVRDWLSYGSEGNPRKKGWSFMDHYVDGLQRTGILGAIQIGIDSMNGYRYGAGLEGLLGPGVSQAWNLGEGIKSSIDEGKVTGKLKHEITQAIPNVPRAKQMAKEALE